MTLLLHQQKVPEGWEEVSLEELPPPVLSEAHSFSGLAPGEDRSGDTTSPLRVLGSSRADILGQVQLGPEEVTVQ